MQAFGVEIRKPAQPFFNQLVTTQIYILAYFLTKKVMVYIYISVYVHI